jgi:integrase
MQATHFDAETRRYLKVLKPGTLFHVQRGLELFQEFYPGYLLQTNPGEYKAPPNVTVKDFMQVIIEDNKREPLSRVFPEHSTLRAFSEFLVKKGFAGGTVNRYVAALQSICKFYRIPITTRYAGLPSANAVNKKYPWNLEKVGAFITSMDKPVYRCLAAIFLQSGLSVVDVLGFEYNDVQEEYENNIVPLCLDLERRKTETPHLTFIAVEAVEFLREYLAGRVPDRHELLFKVSKRAIESYFAHRATKFLNGYEGHNPCCPSSLRTAFSTFLTDGFVSAGVKVCCPETYSEFWSGRNMGDVKKMYKSKTRDSWRQEYAKYAQALSFQTHEQSKKAWKSPSKTPL